MNCKLLTLALAILFFVSACGTPGPTMPQQRGMTPALSDDLTRSTPEKLPDEIADIQKIPQNVSSFADSIRSPMTVQEQRLAVQQFRERYFAPWTASGPRQSMQQSIEDMQGFAHKTWYGENRLKVSPERIRRILEHVDFNRLPSQNRTGIAIAPSFMRALPTSRPLYETADDFPFDQLQYTEVKQNEPLRILHMSHSGAWLFIETASVQGWVRSDTVMETGLSLQQRMEQAEQVVIVRDFSPIRDEKGRPLPLPKIGTLYPLVREEPDHWLVDVAVAGADDQAILKTARIAKQDARRFPMPFTAQNVTSLGDELLKTPYGWGDLFRDRDCSSTTRDFFLPFGIWLPRNSQQQLQSGPFVALAGLPNTDKEQLLIRQGIPFQTLLHRKGHIMLYVGTYHDKPVILHNTWAIRFKTRQGKEEKLYIGRTVLTTLEAGLELPLSKGTLLDHLDGMLLLPAKGLH